MSNKAIGTQFERDFAAALYENGFWVHLFQDNYNGQPCDVIAARNGHTYLFDCKDCKGIFFRLDRMEENQLNAMRLFELTGNSRGKFVIRFEGGKIYLVDYWQLEALRNKGYKQIAPVDAGIYGMELSVWLSGQNAADGWSREGWDDADHYWQ